MRNFHIVHVQWRQRNVAKSAMNPCRVVVLIQKLWYCFFDILVATAVIVWASIVAFFMLAYFCTLSGHGYLYLS